MSKRSRRHKGDKGLAASKQAPKESSGKKRTGTIAGFVIGVVSLALAIAALFGLRARPTISSEPPLDPGNVLTTPIVISNDGMLALRDVNVAFYLVRIDMGPVRMTEALGINFVPPSGILETGEKKSVTIGRFIGVEGIAFPVTYADIGVIVHFKPEYMPFWSKSRVFRFVATRQSDGTMRFQQQPGEGLKEQYQKLLDRYGGKLP